MKNIKRILAALAVLTAVLFTMNSCYTPSPLYGTWADNQGNQIKFISGGTFISKITINSKEQSYQGEWTAIDNVLVFNYTTSDSEKTYSINTEWDVRGAMLYLVWISDEGESKSLTLYHTAK